MYRKIEDPKENKGRAVTKPVAQNISNMKQGYRFVDNRPESVYQYDLIQLMQLRQKPSVLDGDRSVVQLLTKGVLNVVGEIHSDYDKNNRREEEKEFTKSELGGGSGYWTESEFKESIGSGNPADSEFLQCCQLVEFIEINNKEIIRGKTENELIEELLNENEYLLEIIDSLMKNSLNAVDSIPNIVKAAYSQDKVDYYSRIHNPLRKMINNILSDFYLQKVDKKNYSKASKLIKHIFLFRDLISKIYAKPDVPGMTMTFSPELRP